MIVGEAGAGERKRKKTLGRRKIEIKPIECKDAKHVCFSKRREGLYKKASELCALTGAQVAVVVSSPAGKPYSFGHPSVHAVVERYLDPCPAAARAEVPRPAILYDFDSECERLREAIKAEARRRVALDAAVKASGACMWTDNALLCANMPNLVAMLAALERVKAEAVAEYAMREQCAAVAAACDALYYDFGDVGTFTADGDAGGCRNQQAAVDAQMAMLMAGNVASHDAAHATLPFAPMMLHTDLPPPPSQQQLLPYFNYGSEHNLVAGYGYDYDYDYNLGDGSGHGAAYELELGRVLHRNNGDVQLF